MKNDLCDTSTLKWSGPFTIVAPSAWSHSTHSQQERSLSLIFTVIAPKPVSLVRSSYWAIHWYIHQDVPRAKKLLLKVKIIIFLHAPVSLPLFPTLVAAAFTQGGIILTSPILKLYWLLLKFKLITLPVRKKKKNSLMIPFYFNTYSRLLRILQLSFHHHCHTLASSLWLLPLSLLHSFTTWFCGHLQSWQLL